jgi:ADP-heptose:LPS heptosyltransferase
LNTKILVIRFSSIGDIVLTTPVIRVLHEQLGAKVDFLTKPAFAPLLQANPHIHQVITLTEDFDDVIKKLRVNDYDYIVDLHHNLRSARIKIALGKPSKAFYKLNFKKWLVVRFGIDKLPDVHIVDRYFDTVREIGVLPDSKGLDLFVPESSTLSVENEFGLKAGTYVALVTGAAHQTKCMTTSQMVRLCHLLDKPVVLLGGNSEMAKAEEIMQNTSGIKVINTCGKLNLLQSASVIQQSGVVITPDTGMMHIAAALRKPQVVVWGNTIPGFGMYPYYGHQNVPWKSFEQAGLKCRPCSKLGFEKCPKGHFKCMLDHDLEKIAQSALDLASIQPAY